MEPEKKGKKHKKVKMNGGLGWIERARERHELACLGMGTIILVYVQLANVLSNGSLPRVPSHL